MGLHNMAGMNCSTSGTAPTTLTLTTAIVGLQTFANAGVVDGEEITVSIKDQNNGNWEVATAIYTSSGTTIELDTIHDSSASGNAIDLSGDVEVRIVLLAQSSELFPSAMNVVMNNNFK